MARRRKGQSMDDTQAADAPVTDTAQSALEAVKAALLARVEDVRPDLLIGLDPAALTEADVLALINQAIISAKPEEQTMASSAEDEVDLQAIIDHYNLIYIDHVRREERQPDRSMRMVWRQTERPMETTDILSYRMEPGGQAVILVTKDGKKLRATASKLENLME